LAIMRPNEPIFMTADQAATRRGYAAKSELALRNSLEAFCRARWPDARICHEMMMGERKVRADVVTIDPAYIAAFEVKGEYDDTTRLLHQVGMYQLCVPEVWMVVPVGRHAEDARILRYLLPSVGLLVGAGTSDARHYEFDGKDFDLVVEAEPTPRAPHPEMMLEMLWRDELFGACDRLRLALSKKPTRPEMIKKLLDLPLATLQREVCTELRSRDAIWRADAPLPLPVSSLVSSHHQTQTAEIKGD
jgi:hypothetical protein